MNLQDQRVCLHMPLYLREFSDEISRTPEKRFQVLQQNIETFVKQWNVKNVDIYIYSNSETVKEIERLAPPTETIHYFYFIFDFSFEHPQLLVWKCRPIIESVKDNYDIFIYIEDDMGIPPDTLNYWWKWKDILHEKNLDVGLLRVETTKQDEFFSSDVTSSSAFLPITIENQPFVHLHMRYSGGWLCDRKELDLFIKSPYWEFHLYYPKGVGYSGPHICESSAIGYKLAYSATVYPLINKKIDPKCYIYHSSNTYIHKEGTSLGKLRVEDITRNLL